MDDARVAVVTGGTGTLGRTVVEALLGDGWRVHVPWRSEPAAAALERALGSPRLHLAPADLARAEDVARFFAGVERASGRLDALCCLAGGWAGGPIERTSPADWERMIAINATSAFLCCREAAPRLRAAGAGAIVCVASAAALDGRPGMAAYAAAKAGVVALTRALAAELAGVVTVNALAPDAIVPQEERRALPAGARAGRVTPGELAATVRWLLGPEARQVTGTIFGYGR